MFLCPKYLLYSTEVLLNIYQECAKQSRGYQWWIYRQDIERYRWTCVWGQTVCISGGLTSNSSRNENSRLAVEKFESIWIPTIRWYTMPWIRTFSIRKLKASLNSVQVPTFMQVIYLVGEKSRLIWSTEVRLSVSVEKPFNKRQHFFFD